MQQIANLAPVEPLGWGFCFCRARLRFYFSWLEMLVNVVFRFEPIVFTTAMIAIERAKRMVPTSWRAHRDQEHHEVEPGLAILLRLEFCRRACPGASLANCRGIAARYSTK
jgi:hypothetical protein